MNQKRVADAKDDQPLGVRGRDRFLDQEKFSRSDLALLKRAIKGRFPMPRNVRRKLVERMSELLDSPDANEAIGAARVLVTADSLNQKDEQGPVTGPVVNVNVGISQTIQAALNAPEYLEYQRSLAVNSDPGALRSDGERREVEVGPAPDGVGSGAS